jgi:hypothetical protein
VPAASSSPHSLSSNTFKRRQAASSMKASEDAAAAAMKYAGLHWLKSQAMTCPAGPHASLAHHDLYWYCPPQSSCNACSAYARYQDTSSLVLQCSRPAAVAGTCSGQARSQFCV